MGSEQTPSRFASGIPLRPAVETPVEDFAMIPLESVENMLGESAGGSTQAMPGQHNLLNALPPPVFDPTTPGNPVSAPAPASPKPPTVVLQSGASRFRFADMLRPDGTVDTDAVYRFGKVPDVKLSAELILQALANLPPDVPELARHTAIQVTVNSLTQAAGIPIETVASDARVRHTRLMQFRDALRAEVDRDHQPLRQSVADLEAAIAAKQSELEAAQAQLRERESEAAATHRDCDAKLAALQEVIDLMEAKSP